MNRRTLIKRLVAATTIAPILLSGPAQRVVQLSPRYIYDPARRAWTERVTNNVYRYISP